MSQEDKVVYLQKSSAARASAGQETYLQLRQRVVERLSRLLAAMLDQVDDALFERADKAKDNQEQGSFFTAMRQLRLGRRRLEEDFRQALEQAFTNLGQRGGRSGQQAIALVSEADLALLDNEELESSIAIDSMTAKARALETKRLQQLQRCLEILFPRQRIDEDNSPLDPAQFVKAFVTAAADVDIEITPRLVLYKLFDIKVLGELGRIYEDAYQLLSQAGIRPAPVRGQPSGAASLARASGSAGSGSAAHRSEPALPALDGLRQLLTEQAVPGFSTLEAGFTASAAAPAASLQDLLGALSRMQNQASPAAGREVKQTLDQYLAAGPGGRAQQVGSLEGAAIDIVGMLFDVILDDPRLPPRIKALLARLQIPMLKVSLLDGAFFSHKQHPARRLINEMARAAIGWVEPEQLESDPLYSQVKRSVERILVEFDDDPQLFSDLLDDFLIFQEEEQERARLVEERTRQAAEGKARIEQAKSRVSAEIQQRIQGRDLPAVVHRLLGDAWSKVLFLAFLKDGADGAEWQQQLEVVDRLISSVQPQATPEARREQLLEVPQLLQELRDGLNAILFNPFEMSQLFKQLEAEHVRSLAASGAPPEAVAPAASAPPVAQPPPAEVEPAAELDAGLVEHLQRLDQVPIGTWLEFTQGSGHPVRAKLSARLQEGQLLVFVNRSGFKMSERKREDVARELRSGSAVILSDDQLFDSALEAVIANLRTARAGL